MSIVAHVPCAWADIRRREFGGSSIAVSDIDEASMRVLDMFSAKNSDGFLELRPIAANHILALTDKDATVSPTVLSIYDTILQYWITSLPSEVSAAVRQRKEHLARRIAAELVFSSTRFRYHEESPPVPEQQLPSQESGITFPDSSSQPIFSQPGPSQPQFTIPIIPPRPPPSSTHVQDPLNRLAKHLYMEPCRPTPIPPHISKILSHWLPGTDPSTYSWEATEDAVQGEFEWQDEAAQQKREKARRKQERKEKRQRKEDEVFRNRTMDRELVVRSSPGLRGLVSDEVSSQVPPQSQSQNRELGQGQDQKVLDALIVQSQVEPGKHGGRTMGKEQKKKKRRKDGF